MRKIALAIALLGLTACTHPAPPQGRWEGTYDSGGTLIAARLEIEADGLVRVSAPNISDVAPDDADAARAKLASDLDAGWESVQPRAMDFDGETFRKPGGIAPQMIWKAKSKQMRLMVYLGKNPGLDIAMRQVGDFSDNPFGS
jgi:hypothetical protein